MDISVIIPMYNSEKTILKCLDSVKIQTHKCDEIIVINDGSNDNSKSIVEQYIHANPEMNITLIDKENGGVSTARNIGIKSSQGDFIALLDSDDCWEPTKIEKQWHYINIMDIDFIGTYRNSESFFIDKNDINKLSIIDMLIKMRPQTSTVLIRKSVLDIVGNYDETMKYAEDGNLWFRIVSKYKCYILKESLVITGDGKFSYGESGLSSNLLEMHKGQINNFRMLKNSKVISKKMYLLAITYENIKYQLRRIIVWRRRK